MSKHTPGPWVYERSKGWGDDFCITQKAGKRPFFKAVKPQEYYTDWPDGKEPGTQILSTELAIKQGRHVATEEIRKEIDAIELANARLIAAAPELLEAAKGMVKHWDRHYWDFTTSKPIEALRAAIAKAEGEQT